MQAGQRIAAGERTREQLLIIYQWKLASWRHLRHERWLDQNSDAEIADALRLASEATTERAAVAVLVGLEGIRVPVASAVLTCIDPSRFTVLDVRALEGLGVKTPDRSIGLYLRYNLACRRIAAEHEISLRDLDRALWQWSKERHGRRESA